MTDQLAEAARAVLNAYFPQGCMNAEAHTLREALAAHDARDVNAIWGAIGAWHEAHADMDTAAGLPYKGPYKNRVDAIHQTGAVLTKLIGERKP